VKGKVADGAATSPLVERAIQAEVAYDPQEPTQVSATVNWVPKKRYTPAKQKTAKISTPAPQIQDKAQSQRKSPKPTKEEPQGNKREVRCYNCNQRGHFANWLPLSEEEKRSATELRRTTAELRKAGDKSPISLRQWTFRPV
jgi:hypothetical protein